MVRCGEHSFSVKGGIDNMIFTYRQIANLNDTEAKIYQYITKNMQEVLKMSVRQLAEKTYVSTATIVRFCQKMECEGFVEFKAKLKIFYEGTLVPDLDEEVDAFLDFFNYSKSDEFKNAIDTFVDYLFEADTICFLGIGTSGVLGEFGARFFSNVGYFALSINDPYYPPLIRSSGKHVLIILSESGETREVIDQINLYKRNNAKILAITNKPESTIARMADAHISYFVKDIILPQTYNISSQVPVIYILERLTKELQKRGNRILPFKTSTRND